MTQRVEEQSFRSEVGRGNSISIGSALFLTALLIVGLSALAFWPSKEWTPPRRPGIPAPIVFDEFVNPAPPAPETLHENGPAAP